MNDYRLFFPDEQTWWKLAEDLDWAIEYVTEDAEIPTTRLLRAEGIDFDVIGTIYKNIVENDVVVGVPQPGYHINIRFHSDTLPASLYQYRVLPNNPKRTFAGGWFEGI